MLVTIKDVAALAGVSPSTVSRTCNNNPSISKETRNKVLKAMAQLGYEPNVSSSNTAFNDNKTIGIILPPSARETYENPFYLETIRGISQFCNQHHYINTVITGQDDNEILNVIRIMVKNNVVSGFIVMYSKQDDSIVDYLYNEGLIYVLIGKVYKNANQTVYIDNDNFLAGQEATDYLINLGHKKIAYIGSETNLMFSADRKNGYQFSLENHKIERYSEYCIELNYVPEENISPVYKLLNSCNRPTAVLVSDDIFAVALERICIEMGISIPKDLSIISFNNSILARLTSPQLTSIDINSTQLGIESASQIINHIENPNLMATKIIVPHQLIERKSCCAIT